MLRQLPGERIGVVASADQNYAKHLAVMFYSLLKNCSQPDQVALFCIDGGIDENTKAMMQENILAAGGTGIDFIQIDRRKYESLPTIKHITSAAYYRISIPDLFDQSVKKILYLDCDMIVNRDIRELWETDISDYHVGAVENLSGHTYKTLGIPQNEYFNSGMLLINLDLWRRDNIPNAVIKFKVENPHRISSNDQCALNGILHTRWKHLPPKWNQQKGIYRNNAQNRTLGDDNVREAILNPGIIHYIGKDKPWGKVRLHPLADEYDRYLDEMTFENREPPSLRDYLNVLKSYKKTQKLLKRLYWQWWYRKNGHALYK